MSLDNEMELDIFRSIHLPWMLLKCMPVIDLQIRRIEKLCLGLFYITQIILSTLFDQSLVMKNILPGLLLVFISSAFAQTAQEYYHRGNEKSQLHDYAGSIVEYDNAIKLDTGFTDAYYNRGSSKLYMKNYKEAIEDFNKV